MSGAEGLRTVVKILPTLIGLWYRVACCGLPVFWTWRRNSWENSPGRQGSRRGWCPWRWCGCFPPAPLPGCCWIYSEIARYRFPHRHHRLAADELYGNGFLHHVCILCGGESDEDAVHSGGSPAVRAGRNRGQHHSGRGFNGMMLVRIPGDVVYLHMAGKNFLPERTEER